MKWKRAALALCGMSALAGVQAQQSATYRVETSANASSGTYAPLWFTAGRYGLSGAKPNSGYLRAGMDYESLLGSHWRVKAGADLAGTLNQTATFVVQQAYADISWKKLTLSIGSKEREGFPLTKNRRLSSGMMVEGWNARPIPQVRAEVGDYLAVPGTRHWLSFKGHVAYGLFTDGRWQQSFAGIGQVFTKNVLYHSKSLMLKVGNETKFPWQLEVGLLVGAQFGGQQLKKLADGSAQSVRNMPNGVKDFLKIFIPKQESTLANVEGNHCGSWNFALAYSGPEWKVRGYLEHYFEDHSQMFWQYGRWKDGHVGVEVTLPRNPWVRTVLWEGLSTKDQTGPILYDGVGGSFKDLQMSGRDNYYNNGEYKGWQHWGEGLGNPLLPGILYNADGSNYFKSNRVRAHHVGVEGDPAAGWSYRVLASFARHWGTYEAPLDRQRKQFSSLWEVTRTWKGGWSVAAGVGLDRGNYLGNSTGGILTLKKTGGIF